MGFSPSFSPRSTPRPALPCSVPRRLASLGAVSLACQPGVTNRSICRRLEGAGERGQGYPCLPPSPTLLPTHIPFCLWLNSWQTATLRDSSSYQTRPPDPCYFKPQVLRPPNTAIPGVLHHLLLTLQSSCTSVNVPSPNAFS